MSPSVSMRSWELANLKAERLLKGVLAAKRKVPSEHVHVVEEEQKS